jgi:hypothetical protein
MAPKNLVWDPKRVSLVAVGVSISGFAPGDSMIEITPNEPMISKTEVSPQGDTVRAYSADKLYRAKFTLMSGDPLNKVLYGLAAAKTVGPFLLKSLSDGRVASGPESYVEGVPSPKLDRGHNGLEWTIAIPQCEVV